MAATIKCYGHGGAHIANNDIDWAADTVKLTLHTSAYAVSQANDEFFAAATNELAGTGGYTSGGVALTTKSRTYDATTREERFIADNFSIAALTPSAAFRYAVIRDVTASDALLAYINFGADQNPAGLPFAIQWAATGVFYIQAS